MSDEAKPPTLWEMIQKKVFDRFGRRGIIVLGILLAAFGVWPQVDKVRQVPGIDKVVERINRWSVPEADPKRFSLMVARLENDENHRQQELIVEALKEFEGVQVLVLDRTISLKGPVPEKMEREGHEEARRYLKQSGGSVLIWGMVMNPGGSDKILKLYWTPSHGRQEKPKRYGAPMSKDLFRLPEDFWKHLSKILILLVVTTDAEFSTQQGQNVDNRLPRFVAKVRKLLETTAGRPGWNVDDRGTTHVILGNALQVLGDQSGESGPLEEAVIAYQEALKTLTRDRVPLQWAMTQNNLGVALRILGEREGGTARLEQAVATCQEALAVFSGDHQVPQEWAATQNNLGNALTSLGERQQGTASLERALLAYREVLQKLDRDRFPLEWAGTQNNLGVALWILGERASGTEWLEEAKAAFRQALTVYTSDRAADKRAKIMNSLELVSRLLSERKGGKGQVVEAERAQGAASDVLDPGGLSRHVERTSGQSPMRESLLARTAELTKKAQSGEGSKDFVNFRVTVSRMVDCAPENSDSTWQSPPSPTPARSRRENGEI